LANGRRGIIDIFLPGDVIGLDTALRIRPLEAALALTTVTAGVIQEQDALVDLMASQPTAFYITWLLAQRQLRADQLLISVLSLDARGRVATMLLDIYTRLRRRRLITGSTYNLPLTQVQIGSYLGLTVVHVNRVLRSLREERIVQMEKHCVTILDLNRLRTLAQRETVERAITPIAERPSSEIALSSGEAAD
jgi:CRP-like cAMP-binding protein